MQIFKLAAIIFLLSIISSKNASAEWVFQLSSGSAYNIPMPLTISQDGERDISLTAEYDTNAFSTQAYYYDFRVGKWKDNKAWEFETLHHKVYLANGPSEVDYFNISHGYNLNTINRAWLINDFIVRLGLGIVITHPETSVRGKVFSDEGGINGFHLSGVTGQGAVEKRFPITEKWFVSAEAKFTASYASIPIKDGDASVPVTAFHGLFGIGYSFK